MSDALRTDVPPGYRVCDMPDGPFTEPLGPLFIRQDGGGFALRAADRHCNARGVMHGGMLITLADQTLGLTVQRAVGTVEVATVSLNCDLVDSARPGELVEGEATVTRITRSIVFVRGSLRCGERVLLSASGLWKRLQDRPGSAGPTRHNRESSSTTPQR
ncbi:MAG TPA: PaaI family thioesterase [Rubrivivax sp.]|nr:PaaI family thioesterase [Rubrivivax sp.]